MKNFFWFVVLGMFLGFSIQLIYNTDVFRVDSYDAHRHMESTFEKVLSKTSTFYGVYHRVDYRYSSRKLVEIPRHEKYGYEKPDLWFTPTVFVKRPTDTLSITCTNAIWKSTSCFHR